MAIVDQYGQPISTRVLTDDLPEHDSISGRLAAYDVVLSKFTPDLIVSALERSAHRDVYDYLTFALEAEERLDPYSTALSTRKMAASRLPWRVEAASDDAIDKQISDDIEQLMRTPMMADVIPALHSAIGPGYAVLPIQWDTSERQWMPKRIEYTDPRWYRPAEDAVTLRRLDPADLVDGVPLEPYRYIVHRPRLRQGPIINGGLARSAAYLAICAGFALKSWMGLASRYGVPSRIGKWRDGASDQDKAVLRRAVRALGNDAAAVMPQSMVIDLVESTKGANGPEIFERLLDYLERRMSVLVHGQVLSSRASGTGLGSGVADLQSEVRTDILDHDGAAAAKTLNAMLVEPFVRLNYGPRARVPMIVIESPKPEDNKLLIDALEKLVPLGLRVEESTVLDRFGLPSPAAGARVLVSADAGSAAPVAPTTATALNAADVQPAGSDDVIDKLVTDSLSDWQDVLGPVVDEIQSIATNSANADEFRARLKELVDRRPADELVRRLATSAFIARGIGDATDSIEP